MAAIRFCFSILNHVRLQLCKQWCLMLQWSWGTRRRYHYFKVGSLNCFYTNYAQVRKGEPTRFTPCFTSVQTVPVPVDANNLTPISCVTLAGTVAVVRVYPLLAATTGGYGEDPSTPSSESMVLSCSYSVIISYGTAGLNPSVIVTKCMSSLVTAEFQVGKYLYKVLLHAFVHQRHVFC